MRLRAGTALACMVILVASCSSGSSGPATATTAAPATSTSAPAGTTTSSAPTAESAKSYRDALAVGLAAGDAESGDIVFDGDAAECIAEQWVEIIGTEALAEDGLAPVDLEVATFDATVLGLDADQGTAMIDAVGDCGVDLYQQTLEIFSRNLTTDQAACLWKNFDANLARQYRIESLIQTDLSAELNETLTAIDTACELSAI